MSKITETLEAIEKGLESLLVVDESSQPEAQTFTPEQFIAYVAEQIELAKSEEDSTPRLNYVREIVALAKAGGFEDKQTVTVPLYQSGPLSVQGQSAYSAVTESTQPMSNKANEPGDCGAFARDVSSPSMPEPKAAESTMPPVSMEPASSPEGFLAKSAEKTGTEKALLDQLSAVLTGDEAKVEKTTGDGWVHDLATPQFLDGKAVVDDSLDDFGNDPR